MSRIMLILSSSAGLRAWLDYYRVTVDEAADDVDWTLRTLLAATDRRSDR
jgi:hypothetical protein